MEVYTASIANYINAEELQNFTLTEFTLQTQSWFLTKKIESLSYNEANEMANFGANILHAKTIIPLLEKIFHSNSECSITKIKEL
jgi:aspartokinase